jgi:D-xylose transport system substrate-binding protein
VGFLKKLQERWKVDSTLQVVLILVVFALTGSTVVYIKKFIQPLITSGQVKVVMDQAIKDWQPSEAQKLMEQALTAQDNKIDAVLAPNDGTAGGCIQALNAQKMAGKVPVTGQDAELSAAIRITRGQQSMTVYKDTRLLGQKAIELAIKMAKGESLAGDLTKQVFNKKINVPSVLLVPTIVDKNNLEKVLIETGYLKREQVYRRF